MNSEAIPEVGGNPFSPRAVLAVVGLGALIFVALLWMIGAGMTAGKTNNGGNHAASKGLTGFAAMSQYLEGQGLDLRQTRNEAVFDQPGLLVLTPPTFADGEEVNQILAKHRYNGPSLLILPKWMAVPVPPNLPGTNAKDGWVLLGGALSPKWAEDMLLLGKLDVKLDENGTGNPRWRGLNRSGLLPDAKAVQSMSSRRIIPLVTDSGGRVLAGYLGDGGDYSALEAVAGVGPPENPDDHIYPVIVVAEPDLLNNYGFSREESAQLALALVDAAMSGEKMPVHFDLTLNGLGQSANLLTLAFTPPFLAATLCLLMAALAVGWRAFLRFGPPRRSGRAIAFGKQALVANAAGLVRRTGRLHLISQPYVIRTRERIVRALALPRQLDTDHTDAAIDRAIQARDPGSTPFSQISARLRSARNPHDLLQAARELRAVERKLIT